MHAWFPAGRLIGSRNRQNLFSDKNILLCVVFLNTSLMIILGCQNGLNPACYWCQHSKISYWQNIQRSKSETYQLSKKMLILWSDDGFCFVYFSHCMHAWNCMRPSCLKLKVACTLQAHWWCSKTTQKNQFFCYYCQLPDINSQRLIRPA